MMKTTDSAFAHGESTNARKVSRLLLCVITLSSLLPAATAAAFQVAEDPRLEKAVRPGSPNGRPFWNTHAKRFIYPPAFFFPSRAGAVKYLYSIRSLTDGVTHVFESDSSWAPLSPVWATTGPDSLLLLVDAVMKDGSTIPVGERRFIKSPPFRGRHASSDNSFACRGLAGLDSLYRSDRVQSWLETGKPNPDYPLWVYPSKVMGATVRAMTALSRRSQDETQASRAETAAKIVADFLLGLREGPTHPLANWPPTHWSGVERGNHPVYDTEYMTPYPAEAAWSLLDLFDLTKDSTYFHSVIEIARTYRRVQRDDGTWYLILDRNTGLPGRRENPLVPIYVIELLDRLRLEYAVEDYAGVREAAFRWLLANPVHSFAWEAQFEDTRPKPLLENLAYREATLTAKLLLQDSATVSLGEEILRFVEDQFVVWEADDPIIFRNWFREGSIWNGNDLERGKDWFLPASLEQFAFYTPLAGATATVLDAYMVAFQATGNRLYRDKARALADGIVAAQVYHGGGEIPTHMRRDLPELNWINNSSYAALMLIKWSHLLGDQESCGDKGVGG